MTEHVWEKAGELLAGGLAHREGMEKWRCESCGWQVASISRPAPDGQGLRLELQRGQYSGARILSLVPLDCDDALVKGVMES